MCKFAKLALGVSTHSRPKAAGPLYTKKQQLICFNTQPPEGGWVQSEIKNYRAMLFQHTAARRRLENVPPPLETAN